MQCTMWGGGGENEATEIITVYVVQFKRSCMCKYIGLYKRFTVVFLMLSYLASSSPFLLLSAVTGKLYLRHRCKEE